MYELFFVLILLSSIWVYFDAKSIGVRRGQVQGLADMGPGGWFAVTLLLWIIGFPLYLSKRDEFKRLNANTTPLATPAVPVETKSNETSAATLVVAAVVIIIGIGWIWQSSSPSETRDRVVAREMSRIENQVAEDTVRQYEIAKRQGDPIQICVQAGLVSAAFLQAKNEPQFRQWRAVEAAACNR